MGKTKSEISEGRSYQEIGDYWDEHDLSDVWNQTQPAEFDVSGNARTTYYPIESTLAEKLNALAEQRGVSAETLVNLWLQERVTEEVT